MSRPFKIWVEDKETLNKVLAKMEKEGIKWWRSRCVPTNMAYPYVPIALFVDEDNLLSHAGSFEYYELHNNDEVTPEEYLKENKEMTKSDLKDWMVVKTREGSNYMVDNTHNIIVSTHGWMPLDQYSNDLLCITDNDFDIVAVYEVTRPFAVRYFMQGVLERFEYLQPVWESEENLTEMTVAEIEKQLGIKNLKIIKEK